MENSKIEKDRYDLSDSNFIKTKNNSKDSPFKKNNNIQPDSHFSNGTQNNSPFIKGVRGIKGDIENKNHKGYYIPYNRNLKTLSRKLRKESTLAEILLWNELKGKKLEDYGLIFLRFDDREVKKDMPNVLRVIKAKIKELEEIPPAPFKKGE